MTNRVKKKSPNAAAGAPAPAPTKDQGFTLAPPRMIGGLRRLPSGGRHRNGASRHHPRRGDGSRAPPVPESAPPAGAPAGIPAASRRSTLAAAGGWEWCQAL